MKINQKGFAMVMAAIILVALTFIVLATLASHFLTLNSTLAVERRQIQGGDAFQDFALLARRAQETWVTSAGACPAGTTADNAITGIAPARPFCWPDASANNNDCIVHQLSTAGNPIFLCLGAAAVGPPARFQNLQIAASQMFERFRALVFSTMENLDRVTDSKAYAQSVSFLPALAGAPANTIALMTCTGAMAGNQYCKRCTDGPGAFVRNVECVTLRICLNAGAGCAANEWMIQGIGLIAR